METTEQFASDAPSIRASDADRERTSTALHQAAASGSLTITEVEERLSTVYTSKFRYELDALVADLPAEVRSSRQVGAGRGVADSAREVGAAVLALIVSVASLAGRHRRVTAVVLVALVAGFAAMMVFGGPDMDGHDMHGAHSMVAH